MSTLLTTHHFGRDVFPLNHTCPPKHPLSQFSKNPLTAVIDRITHGRAIFSTSVIMRSQVIQSSQQTPHLPIKTTARLQDFQGGCHQYVSVGLLICLSFWGAIRNRVGIHMTAGLYRINGNGRTFLRILFCWVYLLCSDAKSKLRPFSITGASIHRSQGVLPESRTPLYVPKMARKINVYMVKRSWWENLITGNGFGACSE